MKGLSAYLELKENYKGARSLIKEQDDIIKMQNLQLQAKDKEIYYLKSEVSNRDREIEALRRSIKFENTNY